MKKAVKVVSLVLAICGVTTVAAVLAMHTIANYVDQYEDGEEYFFSEHYKEK